MYKIQIHKKVIKFLEKHPKLISRFDKSLDLLMEGKFEDLDIKKLKGSNDFRLRIGKFRFIFLIKNNICLIYFYEAGSRGKIYKK